MNKIKFFCSNCGRKLKGKIPKEDSYELVKCKGGHIYKITIEIEEK